MIHRLFTITGILLLVGASTLGTPTARAASANTANTAKQIVAYFASWDAYGRQYTPAKIPVDKMTVINYAFATVTDQGQCAVGDAAVDTDNILPGDTTTGVGALHGNFSQLRALHIANPALGVSISIGGWTWSDRFSKTAMTAESRQKFVTSCIDLFIKGNIPGVDPDNVKGLFDGVDVDWEYPTCCGLSPTGSDAYSPQDTQDYTLLVQEFRRQLDIQGANDRVHYRLTVAAPSGPSGYSYIDLKTAAESLDWFNLMAYDFNGGWEKTTGFNAPLYAPDSSGQGKLYNADSAVQAYLSAGVPAIKIVLGVPFYGHSWQGVPSINHGLAQTSTGLPKGTWDDSSSGHTGIFDYADIVAHYLPKYQRYWSDTAQVPWLYDAMDRIFISYEDPQSLAVKADYVNQHDLGGMMLWEISSDNGDLLNTIARKLKP